MALIISRRRGERFFVGLDEQGKPLLRITVYELTPERVKLGIEGDRRIAVWREEWRGVPGEQREKAAE